MNWIPLLGTLLGSRMISGGSAGAQSPLEKVDRLKDAGAALGTQWQLLNRLFAVEWAELRGRVMQMLVMVVVGALCLICVMLFGGIAVVVLTWDTPYRNLAVIAVLLVYAGAGWFTLHRLQRLSRASRHAFAATREELAADIALLKSKLWT